ncbi:MAG TPA: hypothetical protein PLB38_00555 [bacterium]|nr:hypothetical protein [bacterium]
MNCTHLRPEALKREFRETYKEVEGLLARIVLPYHEKAPTKRENSTNERKKPKLENMAGVQTFTSFLSLAQGRKLLKRIRTSGGGVAEETFDAALGTIFELECQFNQLIILLQVQELVDHSDPLLIELIGAYAQIRIRVNNLINMASSQMDGYDKFHHYDDDIKRWKYAIKGTAKELFDEEWGKAVGVKTDNLQDCLVLSQ